VFLIVALKATESTSMGRPPKRGSTWKDLQQKEKGLIRKGGRVSGSPKKKDLLLE